MRNEFVFSIAGYILPVTPGEISISNGVNVEKIELATGEKIPRFVGKELKTISFTAEFPRPVYARTGMFEFTPVYRPYVRSEALSPVEYWNEFFSLMSIGEPVDVYVYGHGEHLVSGHWLIESMERNYSAENGSELQVNFTLVQYRKRETVVWKDVVTSSKTEEFSGLLKTFSSMNESAKKFLTSAAENTQSLLLDANLNPMESETSDDRPYYNAYDVPEFHITKPALQKSDPSSHYAPFYQGRGEGTLSGDTFTSLSYRYYKDMNHVALIRGLNPDLSNYTFSEFLPSGKTIRLRMKTQ